jgi:hypothetical protein
MTHIGLSQPEQLPTRSKLWRVVLSGLLAVAVLLSSLHHLSCGDDELSGAASTITVAIEKSAPPSSGDQCLPGHCHCVCHVSVQAMAELVSSTVDFGDLAYGLRADHLSRGIAALPPFKPPRA